MRFHSDSPGIERRLKAVLKSHVVSRSGTTYRMVTAKWTKDADVTNGNGALKESGRWNVKGTGCVTYSSFSPETALAESLEAVRYFGFPVHKGLPKVLVSLRFQLKKVLDLTDGKVRQKLKMGEYIIRSTDWRSINLSKKEAVTQAVGRCAHAIGLEGLMVPSAVDSAGSNLIVFPENLSSKSHFNLVMKIEWPK